MQVYVVYWFDLDDDCLKKSEIEILGVFTDLYEAKKFEEKYADREGYCEDKRCYGTRIEEVPFYCEEL